MKNKILALLLAAVTIICTGGCFAAEKPNENTTLPTEPTTMAATHEYEPDETTTKAETTAKPSVDARARDAAIYETFLKSGELEKRTAEDDRNYIELSSCLADLNNDGVYELLLRLTNTEFMGVRGYPSYSVVYTIKNSRPVEVATTYYGGGSGGGEVFEIRYNQKNKNHVLVTSGDSRIGAWAGENYLTVHSFNGNSLSESLKITSYFISTEDELYREDIDKVLAETDLYTEENGIIYYNRINDAYVSAEDCDSAFANFISPTDSSYQLKVGSFSDPIQ